ncbi:MAG: hypothetical protein V3V20_11795 [Algisphaera sp.]
MPPTTRELNVKTISVITLTAVFLLIATVYTARAGYQYFSNRQAQAQWDAGAQQTFDAYGVRIDNANLAKLNQAQEVQLSGDLEGTLSIDQAMKQVVSRHPNAAPASHESTAPATGH